MAGSHKTGAASADVNLFENAYYIFTPSSLTTQDTLEEMKDLLSGLHARFIEIDAEEHDRVTSQISHFPHILASGLMEQTAKYAEEHEMARCFAAGGFRDMTRIAESEPGMWTSILLSNRETIIERIEDFKGRLDEIGQAISAGDENQIWNFFNQAREQRQAMESISVVVWIALMTSMSTFLMKKMSFYESWNCYVELPWLTSISTRKTVKIFTGSYKFHLKTLKTWNELSS